MSRESSDGSKKKGKPRDFESVMVRKATKRQLESAAELMRMSAAEFVAQLMHWYERQPRNVRAWSVGSGFSTADSMELDRAASAAIEAATRTLESAENRLGTERERRDKTR